MTDKQKGLTFVVLGSMLGGAMGAVTKIGLSEIPPLSFAFLRFFTAFIVVFPFMIKSERKILRDFKKLAPLSLLAATNIAFFTLGVKITTATISQILYAGVPLIVGLVSFIFLKEKLENRKILGILIGFFGVLLIILLPILQKGETFSGDLLGNLLILLGVICWSLYMVFSKRMQKAHPPFVIVSIFIIVTTLVLFPFFLLDLKTNYGWWEGVGSQGITSMLYVIFMGTIVAYLLTQYAIKHGGSVFASMAFYLQPTFGFLTAFILIGEKLTSGILIGGALSLLGVFFVTKK